MRLLSFRSSTDVSSSLPAIEFQPEIITNNDGMPTKQKCEVYTGTLCRSILGSNFISVTNQNQKDIEQNLVDTLKILTKNQFLSSECHRSLLPMVCSFTYPLCDQDRLHVRSICRQSCHYFQTKACPNLFPQAHMYSNGKE